MAFTNIQNWEKHYHFLLFEKYNQFCNMFHKDEEPSYQEFVNFVWLNTSKNKNHNNGKIEAKIN